MGRVLTSDLIGDNSQSENDKEASEGDSPKVRVTVEIRSKNYTHTRLPLHFVYLTWMKEVWHISLWHQENIKEIPPKVNLDTAQS